MSVSEIQQVLVSFSLHMWDFMKSLIIYQNVLKLQNTLGIIKIYYLQGSYQFERLNFFIVSDFNWSVTLGLPSCSDDIVNIITSCFLRTQLLACVQKCFKKEQLYIYIF